MAEQKRLDRPELWECPHCLGTGLSDSKVMGSHTDCPYCQGTGQMKTKDRPELRQRIIEILVKPLKITYQQYADEAMVQGAINQAEEILVLIPDIEEAKPIIEKQIYEALTEEAKRRLELLNCLTKYQHLN